MPAYALGNFPLYMYALLRKGVQCDFDSPRQIHLRSLTYIPGIMYVVPGICRLHINSTYHYTENAI